MFVFDRNSKFFIRNCGIFCLLIVFASAGKINAAGSLDTTFGTGGKAFATVGNSSVGNEVAIQSDGKIVVAGYLDPLGGSNFDFAVVRFNPNGTLDTTFDGDGKVSTPVGTNLDIAYTVAIQADGKIVVAGGARVGIRDDFALVRYNPDGSLDTTFDGDGKVITSIGAGNDFIQAIVIQPDGKILVAGNSQLVENSNTYFAAARYNPDGSLDTTFDGDGKLTAFLRSAPNFDSAYEVALQPDGKILLAGESYPGLNNDFDFALVRLNADGSLDTSFDGDGKLTTSVSPTNADDGATGIALQPDGKIVVSGYSNISTFNDDSVVLRYNPNGSLDTSFDGDGKVFISFTHLVEALLDVAIQADGKIVVAGYKSNNSGSPTIYDIALARINPNGSLDTTFDGDGTVITQLPPGDASAFSMKILPNGKIITAGYRRLMGNSEFMVTRYMGDLNVADFDGDTKTDISIFRPSNGQWWFSHSSDNSNFVLTFGLSTDKIVPADYTGDGKSDVAVYRPSTGEWYVLRSEDFSYYAFPFGISTDTPVPADYDGDGRSDPAVYRSSTSVWYILKSSGGIQITPFGIENDKPVPADYDGDGRADIAIYRAPFQWWIQQSSTGNVLGQHLGSQGFAVPGDYTGDGKADIAAFSTTFNAWYIRRSENGSIYTVIFGTSSDKLVPGDYDGDGVFDHAFFRPSNNTWNIRRSTGGTFQQTFGTNGDIPTPNAFVP